MLLMGHIKSRVRLYDGLCNLGIIFALTLLVLFVGKSIKVGKIQDALNNYSPYNSCVYFFAHI